MQANLPAIRRRFEQADDSELIRIAHADESEYIQEVIALAREELDKRKVEYDKPEIEADVARLRSQLREEKRTVEDKALHPLAGVGCAVFGVIVSLIAAAVLHTSGRKRASQEAIVWGVGGLVVKMVLIGIAANIGT